MTERLKTVGVMGGMGPAATVDFLVRLLAEATARQEQDLLRVLTDNDPTVPDRNAALAGQGPSAGPSLAQMARGLHAAGAEILAMPCNAAHAYQGDIRAATPLPFVSIIDATVAEARRAVPRLRTVGVIAAGATIDARLYDTAFAKFDIATRVNDGPLRERFMAVLYRIKSGDMGPASKAEMRGIAVELIAQGAQAIVAGCTEVPLVLEQRDIQVPLVNSTDCLVAATLAAARA